MPITKFRPTFTVDQERLDALKTVVPEAFADGKINWETLKEALGEHLEDEGRDAEHFGLFWPGKREARRLASQPSAGTLKPVPGEGINEDTTRHIFIEGDNLEVLKLLQKSYAGQVKMIYIDPPYNTGSDLIYNDNFVQPLEEYLLATKQVDEAGRIMVTNTKAGGRYHANWLTMMYSRLKLARLLLSPEGIICASIDDNEVYNLRMLLNEIFGEENFVSQIVIQSNPRGRQSEKFMAAVHEYVLVFAKDVNECSLRGRELTSEQLAEFRYTNEQGFRYRLLGLRQRGSASRREDRPKMYFPIFVNPLDSSVSLEPSPQHTVKVLPKKSTGDDGRWMWSPKKVSENLGLVEARLISTRGEWDIFVRDLLNTDDGEERTRKAKTIWDDREFNYQHGTQEVKLLFGQQVVEYPKPVALLRRIVSLCVEEDDIVLDLFAGSCTTAHAVLTLNRDDGETRRYIMVQLPEATPSDSSVRKAGYFTIAEIGKERIRRVLRQLQEENASQLPLARLAREDLGFRVFKLDRSQFKAWHNYEGQDIVELQTLFDRFESPLADNWQPADLLVEIMLLEGFPLDSTTTHLASFVHNSVIQVASDLVAHRLYVCLDSAVHDETIEALVMDENDIFVCLDSALSDEAKVRLEDGRQVKVI